MPDRRVPHWARWTSAGLGVAVVSAAAYVVLGAGSSTAATAAYRTATVGTGSVTQTITLSGSVQRVNQVGASFRDLGHRDVGQGRRG